MTLVGLFRATNIAVPPKNAHNTIMKAFFITFSFVQVCSKPATECLYQFVSQTVGSLEKIQ